MKHRNIRDTLGAFATGVTVVTTIDSYGKPWGLTVNSFSSVSLDPPLIIWSQSKSSPSYSVFQVAERFAVNILSYEQEALSNHFARPADDKFAGVAWKEGVSGMPLLDGCCAYIECERVESFSGGDHTVFMGRILEMSHNSRCPLIFWAGKYITKLTDPDSYPKSSGISPAQTNSMGSLC